MPLIGELIDDFDGTTLDTGLWLASNTTDGFGFQTDSYYFVVRSENTADTNVTSVSNYDLTASKIHIEVPQMGAQEANFETYPLILTTSTANLNNCVFFRVVNGTLAMVEVVASSATTIASTAYNSTNHRWLRIREASGTVFFEAAPDGTTWSTLGSVTPTIAISALYARVRVNVTMALSTSKTVQVDNVNYLPAPEVVFPNSAIPMGIQFAFAADLSLDAWDWSWTDASDDVMDQTWTVQRGAPNEASDVAPTRANLTLDNPDGNYTPTFPTGAYYPDVRLGVPARVWVDYGNSRLYCVPALGAGAEVAATSALDISGDLDVRVDFHLRSTAQVSGVGWSAVIAGVADTFDEFGWRLSVTDAHYAVLQWTSDGVWGGGNAFEVTSTVPVLPFNSRAVLRATLDINNGSGGHDVVFYLGDSITGAWTQIGETVTGSGTTSVFAADEPLQVSGASDLGVVNVMDADVYYLQVRDGIGGSLVVDANFEDVPPNSPAWVDATGLLWQTTGVAEFTNRWYRITGSVDEWAPRWPYGDLSAQQTGGLGVGEARCDVNISGILRRLGQGQAPLQSALFRALSTQPDVRAYWPGEDLDGATRIASGLSDTPAMSYAGVIDFSSADGLPGSSPLMTLSATSSLSGQVTGSFSGNWIAGCYHNIPSGPGASTTIMRVTSTGTVAEWRITCTAAEVRLTGVDGIGTTVFTQASAPPSFFYGDWVHLRLFVQTDGVNVDWSVVMFPVTIPPSSGSFFTNTFVGTVGQPAFYGVPASAGLAGVGYGQMYVADAIDIQQDDAQIGWAGEPAVYRIARLCEQEGISLRIIGDDDNSALMGVQETDTLLELLSEAAITDGGILYEQRDNIGLVYRTLASLYNQPPNMVLDGLQRQFQNPVLPLLDDLRIRNDITVARSGGSSVRLTDSASIEAHGRYDEQITVNPYEDSQLLAIAGWRLHQGTVEGMRYPAILTNLGVSEEVIPEWVTVDVGTRLRVTNLPPQHPVDAVDLLVQGYSEPVSPVTWRPQMVCSPGSVWNVYDLAEDWVPEEYTFRVETDGSQLAASVNTVGTTLQVEPTGVPSLSPYWTTDAGDVPFDINVGGERMTVTNVAAATGDDQLTGAGNAIVAGATTSFVAPSVVAPAAGDLLICAWQSYAELGTITPPGGMAGGTTTSGTFTSFRNASEVLGGSGATGTRTATFGGSNDVYSAVSVVAHGSSTPVIEELLSGYDAGGDITLTTTVSAEVGWWLVAFQGWDWDPAGVMGSPSGSGWIPVADSGIASSLTSHARVWAQQILIPGVQSVTFLSSAWVTDNQARLYLLSGLEGVGQAFTVTRSVNGVVKSHDAQTPVSLWFTPVIAR